MNLFPCCGVFVCKCVFTMYAFDMYSENENDAIETISCDNNEHSAFYSLPERNLSRNFSEF